LEVTVTRFSVTAGVVSILSATVMAAVAITSFETVPPEEAVIAPLLLQGTEAGMKAGFVKLEKLIEELKAEGKDPKQVAKAIRDAHAQAHGCVRAKFRVLSDIEIRRGAGVTDEVLAQLRQGLFEKEKNYKAWVRFSNGSGTPKLDFIPDGRGMAVKVMGVEGDRIKLDKTDELATQDFLMINFPRFFVKDVKDYAGFFKDQGEFLKTHEEERKIAGGIAMQIVTSPIETAYFSMTPVLYGKNAIKYHARPCEPWKQSLEIGDLDLNPLIAALRTLKKPDDIAAHVKDLSPKYDRYLRQALKNGLAENNACYDFFVQFHTDQKTEPVEDPTVEWKTPFYRVARISIPKQDFTQGRQDEFCENLALTPWHTKVEHQPLGGVQRARKPIYESISHLRREFNLKHELTTEDLLAEPTGEEVFGQF